MKKKKEIIIDDIDVSECEYFIDKWIDEDENGKTIEKETHCCGETSSNKCEDIKDCYFKQLQRMKKCYCKLMERSYYID